MYLNSILKESFFVLKDFDQSYELQTMAKKSLQFLHVPTVGFLCYLDSDEILL